MSKSIDKAYCKISAYKWLSVNHYILTPFPAYLHQVCLWLTALFHLVYSQSIHDIRILNISIKVPLCFRNAWSQFNCSWDVLWYIAMHTFTIDSRVAIYILKLKIDAQASGGNQRVRTTLFWPPVPFSKERKLIFIKKTFLLRIYWGVAVHPPTTDPAQVISLQWLRLCFVLRHIPSFTLHVVGQVVYTWISCIRIFSHEWHC